MERGGTAIVGREIASKRAAEYVRMSSDHQKYSIANQSLANHAYAAARGMTIVRIYADEGRSGLNIDGRNALKQLIADVQAGSADFNTILVYDVSRWGRFQDADESAHYEYICKRAGVAVEYCAEQFENDGSPVSAIVKAVKRAMAGEYSRELSAKVFAGKRRLAQLGFSLGVLPGYGYRRLLVDQDGAVKGVLKPGEQKSIATDRVTLVPGPMKEVAVVRWIFASFVQDRKTELQIANELNRRGIVSSTGRAWDRNAIYQMINNEKYIGNSVWNKTSRKLQTKPIKNDPEAWLRVEGAFEPLIERAQFEAAQAIYHARKQRAVNGKYRKFSDDELLGALRRLWQEHGYLSRILIANTKNVPAVDTYHRRFGGLKGAFQRIGFAPQYGVRRKGFSSAGRPCGLNDDGMLAALRRLWDKEGNLTSKIIDNSESVPCTDIYRRHFGSLLRVYQLIGFVPDSNRARPLRMVGGRGVSNEVLLEGLRALLQKKGALSRKILDEDKTGPCSGTIEYRFGSLGRAFKPIGYTSDIYRIRSSRPQGLTSDQMLYALWQLWRKRGHLSHAVIVSSKDVPSHHVYIKEFGSLTRAYELIGFKVDRHPYRRGKQNRQGSPSGAKAAL